jgi:hypothetical protein
VRLVLELRPPESRLYDSWSERLATVARYSRPEAVHALCEQAWALGARTILAVLDDTIHEALAAFQRWRNVAVWAVVPNMFAFIRDLTDLGMVGAARSRFFRLSPPAMVRTGLGAVADLGGVRRRDFTTGALLVADMELAALRDLRLAGLALHPQLTEIALAGGVRRLLLAVAARAERLGVEAALVTHNPVRAADVLGADLGRFAAVVAPANARGYKMFPDRAAVERVFRSDPSRFLGSEISAAGAIAPRAALAHVEALGLGGAVLDARTVEAAFREGVRPAAGAEPEPRAARSSRR